MTSGAAVRVPEGGYAGRPRPDSPTRLRKDGLRRHPIDHWIVSKPPALSYAAAQNASNSGIPSIGRALFASDLYFGKSPNEQ
jgi:hypothetical protein